MDNLHLVAPCLEHVQRMSQQGRGVHHTAQYAHPSRVLGTLLCETCPAASTHSVTDTRNITTVCVPNICCIVFICFLFSRPRKHILRISRWVLHRFARYVLPTPRTTCCSSVMRRVPSCADVVVPMGGVGGVVCVWEQGKVVGHWLLRKKDRVGWEKCDTADFRSIKQPQQEV